MSSLQIQLVNQKYIRISGIDRLFAACLQELPRILELRDTPAAHARLFPLLTADDEAANREWQESITPELRHLFASAAETVTRDLTQIKPSAHRPNFYSVMFPSVHLSAWMSALNQARLILATRADIDEIDMNISPSQLSNEKIVPVIQITVFGEILGRLVQRELNGRRQLKRRTPAKRKISKKKRKSRKK